MPNADLDIETLERVAGLAPAEARFLARAGDSLGISARAWHRILRVARTIADLAGSERIVSAHLAEAVSFRQALARSSSNDGVAPNAPEA